MNSVPFQDILNKTNKTRCNSPYVSSCSSKRQSAVYSSNSSYAESNQKTKPDERTINQLYSLFKKQGFDNINGLLKFLDAQRDQQTRKSTSPMLRTVQDENDRKKFGIMINEAKQGLNQLEHKIINLQNKQECRNNMTLKYKNLLTEDDENHEYLYENRQDYKKLYTQTLNEKEQLLKKVDQIVQENKQRDEKINSLNQEVELLKKQIQGLLILKEESSQSPRPSISGSDYTFTLNVCNSEVRGDKPISYKDFLHTQSQQIKRI
ncbi:unnamed protein product [Paramecium primaurelia]|uniref:Uncharacterized protein n=1 Tax=Paramecium primaurelia TaxID=5886 RepID=A0A8S1NGA3_PARPR|nr:unnamed protein product [Paramecium primaurelia]